MPWIDAYPQRYQPPVVDLACLGPEDLPVAREKRAVAARWHQEFKELQKEAAKAGDRELAKFYSDAAKDNRQDEKAADYVVAFLEGDLRTGSKELADKIDFAFWKVTSAEREQL